MNHLMQTIQQNYSTTSYLYSITLECYSRIYRSHNQLENFIDDMELFFVTVNQDKVIYQISDRMKVCNHNVENEI